MPILITQKQYDHAISILRKEAVMEPFFDALKKWIHDTYHWDVIDFCLTEYHGKGALRQKRLTMLTGMSDMNCQEEKFREMLDDINGKMLALCKEYDFMDPRKLFPHIGFFDFWPIYRGECVNAAAKTAIPILLSKYADCRIHDIINGGGITVFFTSAEDLEKARAAGIPDRMKSDFYEVLKPLDEFNLISAGDAFLTFDSKEILDRDHKGNLHYYFK
jgi:hypothetical protein